jgi:hypothetical protein
MLFYVIFILSLKLLNNEKNLHYIECIILFMFKMHQIYYVKIKLRNISKNNNNNFFYFLVNFTYQNNFVVRKLK